MKKIRFLLVIASILVTISACSTTAKVWKPYDDITISAKAYVNPDGSDRSSPIQVKIYELSARSTFDNLDFDRAFYEAKTLLSDQLVSEAEYTIQPSETIKHKVDLKKSAHFIAILAGFIDVDNARWKHIYEVKPYGYHEHQITLTERMIVEGKVEQRSTTNDNKSEASDTKEQNGGSTLTVDDIEEGVNKGTESLQKANSAKDALQGLFGK